MPGDLSFIEGQVRFIADETTNAVIVTTLPRVYPEIEATIKQLDKMPRQVLIEVLVAEIDRALIEETRRHWPFLRDRRIDAYWPILNRWIDKE